jgi:hypothetical protein
MENKFGIKAVSGLVTNGANFFLFKISLFQAILRLFRFFTVFGTSADAAPDVLGDINN